MSIKSLGDFTARHATVTMMRVEAGAASPLGPCAGTLAAFVLNGSGTIDGKRVNENCAVSVYPGASAQVQGSGDLELVIFGMPIGSAEALGRPAPRLITMIHEHASLNAALGYAAVSGKPVATAAHADAGTFNYGGALHTAAHANLPIFITGGGGPTAYTGTVRGARDRGGHLWFQQPADQNGIVRNYVKWEKRLEFLPVIPASSSAGDCRSR